MASLAVAAGAALLAAAAASQAPQGPPLEIRFCPASQVRTFPLDAGGGAQSLLLQNAVVINRTTAPVEITDLEIELLDGDAVLDARRLTGETLARLSRAGPGLKASGMMDRFAFQFCGTQFVAKELALGGPVLAPGQGLLILRQPFAYFGRRDALELRARARAKDRSLEGAARLPIRSDPAKTTFRFPLTGVWFAAVGPTPHTAHRWALPEEFAYDIVRLGEGGLTHRGEGRRLQDYYAYGAPVLAAADGVVTRVVTDQSETEESLRRPGATDAAYEARERDLQDALLARGPDAVAGDYVMVDHGDGEHSLYAHLQPGSAAVRVGDRVKAGTRLGAIGSSGNSTEPHLHFQVCDAPDPLNCAGVPVTFSNIALPYADAPRAVQSGDVVETR